MQLKTIRAIVVIVLLVPGFLLTNVFTPSASAAASTGSVTNSPKTTTGGGSATFTDCPAGYVLIQVNAESATFDGSSALSRTYGTCRALNSEGSDFLGTSSRIPGATSNWGTSAGTAVEGACSATTVIVGAKVYKTANGYATGAQLLCGTLPTGSSQTYNAGTIGVVTSTFETLQCSANTVAVGMDVSYGGILDKFGLRCAAITGATQPSLSLTLSATSATYNGSAFTQALTMTPSGGNTNVATTYTIVSGGTATNCALSVSSSPSTLTASTSGTCLIRANKVADANFVAASSASVTFTFNKATPTFSSWSGVTKTFGDSPFSLTAPTVTGALAGSFTYSSETTSVATIASTTASIIGAGSSLITANFTPTNSTGYANASTTMTITVERLTLITPNAPTVTATTGTLKSLDVTWVAISNATSYSLKLYSAADLQLATTGLTSINGTSITINTSNFASLADDTGYKISVSANGTGNYQNSLESLKSLLVNTSSVGGAIPDLSISLTGSVTTAPKGRSILITANFNQVGQVTFFVDGKRIVNCFKLRANLPSRTCSWKPAVQRAVTISAQLLPTNTAYSLGTATMRVQVTKRTTSR